MDFHKAMLAISEGHKVTRKGWNGKGMFIKRFKDTIFTCNDIEYSLEDIKFPKDEKHEENYEMSDFIIMKTADNKIVPWFASQTDMLSNDWEVLDNY